VRGSYLYLLELNAFSLRRIFLFLYVLVLLYIVNTLGRGQAAWFDRVAFVYLAYLAGCEVWARFATASYERHELRIIRLQLHLAAVTALYALSGAKHETYLLYLPQAVSAAIFFPGWLAILFGGEMAGIAAVTYALCGDYQPGEMLPRLIFAVVVLLGVSLSTVALWQKLLAERQERDKEQGTRNQITDVILAAPPKQELLDGILDLIRDTIPHETALLYEWVESRDCLVPVASHGYPKEFVDRPEFIHRLGHGLTGYLALHRKTLLLRDAEKDAPVRPEPTDIGPGRSLRSFLGVPLLFEGKLAGVLELVSDQVNAFSQKQALMLESFAGQLSIGMNSVSLRERLDAELNTTKVRAADNAREVNELTTLADISLAMSDQALDTRALLKTIVQKAAELLGAYGGGILFSDPTRREVRMVVSHNLDAMLKLVFRFGEGMAGHVAENGQPLRVDDYQTWDYAKPELKVAPYRSLLRAIVQVPLIWRKNIIGVLSVSHNTPDRVFGPQDERLLGRLASHAAIAIGNARQHAYLRKLISSSPDAIMAVDPSGGVIEFNDASERILGYRREEILGQPVEKLYWERHQEARRINRLLHIAGEAGIAGEITFARSKADERIPIRLAGTLLIDEFGESIGSLGIMTDLRKITQLERDKDRGDFLALLERTPQDVAVGSVAALHEQCSQLIDMVRGFCHIQYVVLFASLGENDTVLPVLAHSGLPAEIAAQMPHFNWRKAGLQPVRDAREAALRAEGEAMAMQCTDTATRQRRLAGIRGPNATFFANAVCLIPWRLADNYRSILLFGPLSEPWQVGHDAEYLRQVNLTIANYALSWLQALYLRKRQGESELAAKLIVHRARMDLTQVSGKFGRIKRQATRGSPEFLEAQAGEELVIRMAGSIHRALTSRVAESENENYSFEFSSLATLVQNCVERFRPQAEEKEIDLRTDPTVEDLPASMVDREMFSIALGNLLDNALKYGFAKTYVLVRAETWPDRARILVEDLGEPMPESARQNLGEPGGRWADSVRGQRKRGSGLGLWEANAIATAHGGEVGFRAAPPDRGETTHHVSVWLELPIRRP
jgi:PAS domain S-box-containing protein